MPAEPAPTLGANDAPWLARLRRLASMPMLADASRISVGLADLQAAVEAVDAQAAQLAALEQAVARWSAARAVEGAVWDSEGEDWPARMTAAQQARQQAEDALVAASAVGTGERDVLP